MVGQEPVRFSLIEFEYLTRLNCDYIEDMENPRWNITKELVSLWELMGVDFDAGPTYEHIIAAWCKGRICFKETINRHTRVVNYVKKDFSEMFPKWDFDAEDLAVDNIVKVMFNAKLNWKWTMDCWEEAGTNMWVNPKTQVMYVKEEDSAMKEDSGRSRKKARKRAPANINKPHP
ncbi:hypothetical protein F2Q69_00048608 [Brassica cretica]|uniref:DUF1985 domain-containing protein n=1 Tax=Brassica cretica TaxID=69181 RepID=A0A8S9PYR6_BRACR|nr:hypothetical protein F2Q69_00048608 [Brassica cretica]